MKKLWWIFALFFTALVSAESITEYRVGSVAIGGKRIYCRSFGHDGEDSAYVLSFKDLEIFHPDGKTIDPPSIFLRWSDRKRGLMKAMGHRGNDAKDLVKLKKLTTDDIVHKACRLEKFSWSNTPYREIE